mmetsp:Transcript_73183/g.214511  ORF Transcript_73183/g.214511 Transcript_73183/m.214511 type:complete len:290 (+) Transcript_73183:340-1209(+)
MVPLLLHADARRSAHVPDDVHVALYPCHGDRKLLLRPAADPAGAAADTQLGAAGGRAHIWQRLREGGARALPASALHGRSGPRAGHPPERGPGRRCLHSGRPGGGGPRRQRPLEPGAPRAAPRPGGTRGVAPGAAAARGGGADRNAGVPGARRAGAALHELRRAAAARRHCLLLRRLRRAAGRGCLAGVVHRGDHGRGHAGPCGRGLLPVPGRGARGARARAAGADLLRERCHRSDVAEGGAPGPAQGPAARGVRVTWALALVGFANMPPGNAAQRHHFANQIPSSLVS